MPTQEVQMGADWFEVEAEGLTAREAFEAARAEALQMNGSGGYTGTIAEKTSYKVLSVPTGMSAFQFANHLCDSDDPRVFDKWGPAGCVKISGSKWLFFGWASS